LILIGEVKLITHFI